MSQSGNASIADALSGESSTETVVEHGGTPKLSVSEEIELLKAHNRNAGYAIPPKQKDATNPYKSEETGKMTYFYKNRTNQGIILPDIKKKFETWEPGGVIDLLEYLTEEEIINYRHIKKMENPMSGKPMITRLTEKQFLAELRIIHDIQTKENSARSVKANEDSIADPISHIVLTNTQEIKKYEGLSEKEKQESTYNVYSFIKWVRLYTFNNNEYDYMRSQIKNTQALQALLERRQELESL